MYRKNRILYGLFEAKTHIRQHNRVFLVEGYMDVLMLWQSGIQNVVASAGTALTSQQVLLIKRHTSNIILLYDGDTAGRKASRRAIEIILTEGLQVEIVGLPKGEDPDSCIKKLGETKFKSTIEEQKMGFISFILKDFDISKPFDKKSAIEILVDLISLIPDAIGRRVFFEEAAKAFNIEVEFFTHRV